MIEDETSAFNWYMHMYMVRSAWEVRGLGFQATKLYGKGGASSEGVKFAHGTGEARERSGGRVLDVFVGLYVQACHANMASALFIAFSEPAHLYLQTLA